MAPPTTIEATVVTPVDNSKPGIINNGCTAGSQTTRVPYNYAANVGSRKIDLWDVKLTVHESRISTSDADRVSMTNGVYLPT